jgi:hypothetical protein
MSAFHPAMIIISWIPISCKENESKKFTEKTVPALIASAVVNGRPVRDWRAF